jgi:Ca-activated chloride channel family protein
MACLAAAVAVAAGVAWAESQPILPGGCVVVYDKENKPRGECPLEHTDVSVDISGFLARVTLTQRFGNPFKEPIEAVYTFPMSERGAVDTMTMAIGKRFIRGIVKEREEARQIYERARNAGQAASLLDQERPNIFTQSVANILPGDTITITISYVEYLKYEDGEYEFSFPMVVGPRYIPGNLTAPGPDAIVPDVNTGIRPGPASTDQVPDSSRVTPPVTPPGTRAGHDISMEVRIDAGFPIRELQSELHEIDVQPSATTTVVRLRSKNDIPNRDFILRYAVGGEQIGDAVLTHHGDKGGFVTLILQPPARVAPEAVTPKEMIFVIDKSGSMSGFPIEKAKETMKQCVEGMNPDDTFNLVCFSGGLGYCFERPVANTAENRRKALEYLGNLEGGGGTEMMQAINAALGGQDDPKRLRVVCFMTDGFIGNDMAIIDAIQKNVKTARVFAFGIGNSVNRFLIEGMARAGRGASEVVTLESQGDDAAKRFHERIQSPVLTDISIDLGGLGIHDMLPDPDAIPDLFAARPLILTGRYDQARNGKITVRGQTANGRFERTIDVDLPGDKPDHDVLATLWARERVEWVMNQDWLGAQLGKPDRDVKGAVTQLGLEFGLVTQYTSFVAVEERVITKGGKPQTVQVPVEMPDGVSYEGIFGKESEQGGLTAGTQLGAYPASSAAPSPALSIQNRPSGETAAFDFTESKGGGSASARRGGLGGRKDEVSEPMVADAGAPQVSEERAAIRESTKVDKQLPESIDAPKKADEQAAAKSGSPTLDPALQGLAGKVKDGSYESGKVKVSNGLVRVLVSVSSFPDGYLDELKKMGIRVRTELRSRKAFLAEVRVEDLERLASLAYVSRIEPAAF